MDTVKCKMEMNRMLVNMFSVIWIHLSNIIIGLRILIAEKSFFIYIKDKIYVHFCLKLFVYPKYLSWHSTFICEMISDIKRKYWKFCVWFVCLPGYLEKKYGVLQNWKKISVGKLENTDSLLTNITTMERKSNKK